MNNKKGIFIPDKIWTIEKLNFNEKVVLADIYNKSKLENFAGYTKKTETLVEELNLNDRAIRKALDKLTERKLIINNPVKKRNTGKIKTVSNCRFINWEVFEKAKRFEVQDNNKLKAKNESGIFLRLADLERINGWFRNSDNSIKILRNKLQTENLMIFLVLQRMMFYDELLYLYFARIDKNELAEFMNTTRRTIHDLLKSLTTEKGAEKENEAGEKEARRDKKLLKTSESLGTKIISKIIRTLVKMYDMDIDEDEYIEKYITDEDLYIINDAFLRFLKLDFGILEDESFFEKTKKEIMD